MNLKDTLNLPKTAFPMRADLVNREPVRVKWWQEKDVYSKIQEKNKNGPTFILHDGPPFTNGYVHIGTALNKILKDIIVRYKTMRGYRTPYVPGWDCHGLPIEHKVVKELRANGKHFDTITLRNACADYSEKFIGVQRGQFERLGILADWDNAYRTKDPEYEEHIINFIAECVAQGLIYRSKKPVYWSIPCKTALAEAEIEYKDHVSQSIWVKFALEGVAVDKLGLHGKVSVVIWTTTPWTIPSNLAVAVHPNFEYVVIESAGEQYLLAKSRLEDFAAQCHWDDYKIVATFKGVELDGLLTKHPIIDRTSRIVLAQYVTADSGTGCVHIAPGHGLEDYNTGLENGLEIYSPIDDDGKYEDDGRVPHRLVGLSVLEKDGKSSDANDEVIKMLREAGALMAQVPYSHQYPHCWRSKTPVIFRAMTQWFIALDKDGLRDRVHAAIDKVEWIPDWGRNRIHAAVTSRNDWCISRQRAWGVPLPVFYDDAGNALLDEHVIRGIAKKIGKLGSNYWFEASERELLDGITLPAGWNIANLKKGTDSLDVWIDSGNSHSAVLKSRKNLSWPADMYLEGSDQHRGWFQSSSWVSVILGNDCAPFKTVLTHGFIVGADKKKISKSDGKPQTADDYVNKFGADVVRLWIASEDFRNDITISDDIISHVSATYRTIRNTLRFQIGNLYDFDREKNGIELADLTIIDKWILQKTKRLVEAVTAAYEKYELHEVYHLINRFCSVELSAIYHDILKDRLYTFAANSYERRSSQTAISVVLNVLLRILGPVITFTCDEALAYLKTNDAFGNEAIQLLDWPDAEQLPDFAEYESAFDGLLKLRPKVNEQLEAARQAKFIGQSLDAKVVLTVSSDSADWALLDKYRDILPEVFIVSQVDLKPVADPAVCTVEIRLADGERCPRSWKWVDKLYDAGEFGRVSKKSFEALVEKYPNILNN